MQRLLNQWLLIVFFTFIFGAILPTLASAECTPAPDPDLNDDGIVSVADLFLVTSKFGLSGGDSSFDPVADTNCDGTVNIADVTFVQSAIGQTFPTAAPTISPTNIEPGFIEVNTLSEVKITAIINDPNDPELIPSGIILQRQNLDGSFTNLAELNDDGAGGDDTAGDNIFTILVTFNETNTGKINLRVSAVFGVPPGQVLVFSDEFNIPVGVILAPGVGGAVSGPGDTEVIVPANSVDYEVLVGISPAPTSSLAPLPDSNLPLVGAVDVIFQPTALSGVVPRPREPLQLSISASASLPSSEFIVAQQVLTDFINGSAPGLREQFVPVDTASQSGTFIDTQASDLNVFSGIRGEGLFVFLAGIGSGFASGTVSDANGPRPGVTVSNNTNTLVSVTNAAGQYALFISGGPFTVTGFDPFKGSSGTGAGNIITDGSTVTANITLQPLLTPPITRDGIRNAGFERADITSWTSSGSATAIQQLGPTSTGVVINPTEESWMVDITTGPGSIGGTGSSLKQRFRVPAGVNTLRLDFNFVSEEFPEFVGSIFNDTFRAVITTPNGESTFAQVSVNASGGFNLIGDCFFPGGDSTCGQTGWREGSVDLSAFSGTNQMIQVELLFSAVDAGDDIFDTHVLVDNIRFSTVWIDAKIVSEATANAARLQNEVRLANEILSQAGVNVRIRDSQTIADPGGLLDTDITWSFICTLGFFNCGGDPTAEETQLLSLSRSPTATDVNVYYTRSLTGGSACAIALGPDDFRAPNGILNFSRLNLLTQGGTIHQNVGAGCSAGGHILAHELGHLLISPQKAGDALEHKAGSTNFMGGNGGSPLLGIVTRQQSANINRAGAPLLVQ